MCEEHHDGCKESRDGYAERDVGVEGSHDGCKEHDVAREQGDGNRSPPKETDFGATACRSRLAEPGCLEIASDLRRFTPRRLATANGADLAPSAAPTARPAASSALLRGGTSIETHR